MTKPLVSVAAMMLVEDGKIQLTDPVSKFLPAFKGQQVSVAQRRCRFARSPTRGPGRPRDDGAGPAAPHRGARLRRDHAEHPGQATPIPRPASTAASRLRLARPDARRAGRAARQGAARASARHGLGIQPRVRRARAAWSRRRPASGSATSWRSGCSSRLKMNDTAFCVPAGQDGRLAEPLDNRSASGAAEQADRRVARSRGTIPAAPVACRPRPTTCASPR